MKYFLISYRFTVGTEEDWHKEIDTFIKALNNDPELGGRISYKCLKSTKGLEYYHLATAESDEVAKKLSERDFFKHYTMETELVSRGTVKVTPLQLVAET